jgi:hypothetical protein
MTDTIFRSAALVRSVFDVLHEADTRLEKAGHLHLQALPIATLATVPWI